MNEDGEKNSWSSTAFETYYSWASRNDIESINHDKDDAKEFLLTHFTKYCSEESVKIFERMFK